MSEAVRNDEEPGGVEVCEIDLVRLLASAAWTALEDPVLPLLHGVRLHTDWDELAPRLVATSTDRYVIGQGYISAEWSAPWSVFVPLPAVRRIVATLRAESGGRVELVLGEDGLTVRRAEGGASSSRREDRVGGRQRRRRPRSVTVDVEQCRWPSEVDEWLLAEPPVGGPSGVCALAGDQAYRLGRIADLMNQPVAVNGYGPDRPMRVRIGNCFRAVVHPAPLPKGSEPPPVFVPPMSEGVA